MTECKRPFVQIGGQFGGCATTFRSVLSPLNKVFERHTCKRYGADIDTLHLVVRVDGLEEGWKWRESGLKRLRLMRKKRYVSVDACFTSEEWVGQDEVKIKRVAVERILAGLNLCADKLRKAGMDFNYKEFCIDLNAAKYEIEASLRLR